ncbi:MAG: helix-turn-helix transcriptional regulator [Candidatus Bathyarchaeota archaeon]|nr:helix-turn-helix transcriptional regulator [Candidatus Bathyarchaeota archaeon]
MPKPKGTTGATKMKIMAIICHNCEYGRDAYGYNIWQSLKELFYIYLNDCDVRNVYHHLKELCDLGLVARVEGEGADADNRCLYRLTETGQGMRDRYTPYLEIVHRSSGVKSKY